MFGKPEMKSFRLAIDAPGIGRAGEVITMAVTPADTGDQNRILESELEGYRNRGLCADIISEPHLVDQEKGGRLIFPPENVFQRVDTTIGRQGVMKELKHAAVRTTYETQEYGLAAFVPWASENDAMKQYNVRSRHAKLIADALQLDREYRVQKALTTLANWATLNKTTLTSTFRWDQIASGYVSDPISDLQRLIRNSIMPVDMFVMNPDAATALLKHPATANFLRTMRGDQAQDTPLVQVGSSAQEVTRFRLGAFPEFLVCPAKIMDDTTGNIGWLWQDDLIALSLAPSAIDPDSIATFRTYRHKGRSGTGLVVNEYMPYGRGLNGGTMLEVGFGETDFFPANGCGGIIKDLLS